MVLCVVFDVFFFVFCVHFQVGFICKTWLLDRHHIIDCQLMKCAAHTAMLRPTALPAGSLLFYFSQVLEVGMAYKCAVKMYKEHFKFE